MPTNYIDAIDSIYALFESKWKDGRVLALLGKDTYIAWKNVEKDEKPNSSEFWVRVSQQTVFDGQSSLSDKDSIRRFTSGGLIFIQVFCPKSNPQADYLGRKIAVIARDVFRGHTEDDCVWFRNSRINELPEERDTIRFNVIAEYEYDEVSPTGN